MAEEEEAVGQREDAVDVVAVDRIHKMTVPTRRKNNPNVVCASRREDIPSNPEKLGQFIAALERGIIVYPHPRFSRNKVCDKTCTTDLKPESVLAIGWFSKNYHNLIDIWESKKSILSKYHHHFSFTINNEAHSILEPGLSATLQERIEVQIPSLVAICKDLGQDPNESILIHIDPIAVWKLPGSEELRDNTSHIESLCTTMKSLGLSRLHISFMQFSWRSVCCRVKSFKQNLEILDIPEELRIEIVKTKLLPYTRESIAIQTCTAKDVVAVESCRVSMGSCMGYEDIRAITKMKDLPNRTRHGSGSTRDCTCYPFRDIGSARDPCTNGCRYCFMHPKLYEF